MAQANACVEAYLQIPIKLVNVDLKQSLALVARLRVYAFDAYLLVCAMQTHTPLLTLDEPLRAAASSLGIEVLEVQEMKVYTFSEARQKFASVLDSAQKDGAVRVTRRDGRVFSIQPVKDSPSPLAVRGVRLKLRREEIVAAVRESRERAHRGG